MAGGPRLAAATVVAVSVIAAGVFAAPAAAEPHAVRVTLVTGEILPLTVEVRRGAIATLADLPPLPSPVQRVEDLGPAPEPTATPTPGPPNRSVGEGGRLGRAPTRAPRPDAGQRRGRPRTPRAERRARARPRHRSPTRARAPARHRSPTRAPAPVPPVAGAAPARGLPAPAVGGFRIPPFLLPIYRAAASRYGVRWEILAAINEIETDYGRDLRVSSAGARGWMQFMPGSWRAFGTDGNADGVEDPDNPVDAIFAAARYLEAAGVAVDLRGALFAYNHADWYVDSVLVRAAEIGALPGGVVESLTRLMMGRFPVRGRASYARRREPAPGRPRRDIEIFARAGTAVEAVDDGRIIATGHSPRLGRFVRLRDRDGTTYTYARLGRLGHGTARCPRASRAPVKQRLFAHPSRPRAARAGGRAQLRRRVPATRVQRGARVVAGTVLGRIGRTSSRRAPHMRFEIRPAGRGAPRIDPKPILDGWKLLESTGLPRAETPALGEVRLMSKDALGAQVLADPRLQIDSRGRSDIRAGQIDRRVLATLEFLSAAGFRPTVTSLKTGHGFSTSSGTVSEHSSGNAVDIAEIDGIPILGNQGDGSITERLVRRLLTLRGAMKPDQIITLTTFEGADNTLALPDHADHVHVGWKPPYGTAAEVAGRVDSLLKLKPEQWMELIGLLGKVENPSLRGS